MTQINLLILVALQMLGGLFMFGCSRQSSPTRSQPAQSQPAQSQPAQSQPAQPQPAQSQSAQSQSAQSQSAQSPSGPLSAAAPDVTGEPDRGAPSEQLPDWSLGESDFQSLGSPYKMLDFEIRPPASFRFIKSLDEPKTHSTTYYWVGPVRKDETYPQFFVIVSGLSPPESNAPLANLLKDVLQGIQRHRKEWSATPAEYGRASGLTFARCSWSGVATSAAREGLAGRKMHGVVYLTLHDNQAVQIMCQDVAPDHAESLKQGGEAALSFRVATAESKPR